MISLRLLQLICAAEPGDANAREISGHLHSKSWMVLGRGTKLSIVIVGIRGSGTAVPPNRLNGE